jgi:hypothetical protein
MRDLLAAARALATCAHASAASSGHLEVCTSCGAHRLDAGPWLLPVGVRHVAGAVRSHQNSSLEASLEALRHEVLLLICEQLDQVTEPSELRAMLTALAWTLPFAPS